MYFGRHIGRVNVGRSGTSVFPTRPRSSDFHPSKMATEIQITSCKQAMNNMVKFNFFFCCCEVSWPMVIALFLTGASFVIPNPRGNEQKLTPLQMVARSVKYSDANY